jgi:hypothetical protein
VAETFTIANIVSATLVGAAAVADWGVSDRTKETIRNWLESRQYGFRYTTLGTFGQKEIAFSISVVEKAFGSRLFSWRRLNALIAAYIICFFVYSLHPKRHGVPPGLVETISVDAAYMALFALSISLTIWASKLIGKVPGGNTIAATFVLTIFHFLLFVYWRPIVEFLPTITNFYAQGGAGAWSGFINSLVHSLDGIWVPLPLALEIQSWSYVVSYEGWVQENVPQTAVVADLTGVFAYVLRIGLTLTFLIGVLYVSVLRPILIWFWTGLIRSPALFTPPATAIAAAIYVVSHWSEIISAL